MSRFGPERGALMQRLARARQEAIKAPAAAKPDSEPKPEPTRPQAPDAVKITRHPVKRRNPHAS